MWCNLDSKHDNHIRTSLTMTPLPVVITFILQYSLKYTLFHTSTFFTLIENYMKTQNLSISFLIHLDEHKQYCSSFHFITYCDYHYLHVVISFLHFFWFVWTNTSSIDCRFILSHTVITTTYTLSFLSFIFDSFERVRAVLLIASSYSVTWLPQSIDISSCHTCKYDDYTGCPKVPPT